jgi:hypothetical protein
MGGVCVGTLDRLLCAKLLLTTPPSLRRHSFRMGVLVTVAEVRGTGYLAICGARICTMYAAHALFSNEVDLLPWQAGKAWVRCGFDRYKLT